MTGQLRGYPDSDGCPQPAKIVRPSTPRNEHLRDVPFGLRWVSGTHGARGVSASDLHLSKPSWLDGLWYIIPCTYLALQVARTAAMTVALYWLFSINERSYQLLFLGAIVSVVFLVYHVGETRQLKHIPTMGFDSPILSYLDAFRYLTDSKTLVDETVAKFPNKIVKVPDFLKWKVVVSEANAIQEAGSISEHELSSLDAVSEFLQTFSDRNRWVEQPSHRKRKQPRHALPEQVLEGLE